MTMTLPERKAKEVTRLQSAAVRAMAELQAYACRHGGRFIVFGSFARGDVIYTSDLDIMVDFPTMLERAARSHAEAACWDAGLVPDVHLASESSDALKSRVERDAIFLP